MVAVLLAGCGSTPFSRRVAPSGDFTYVAIGASDAFGIGTGNPDQDNWPRMLAEQMGTSTHLVNLGVPGITLAQAQQTELPIALDAHPNIITVWLAVNDLADGVPLATYRAQLALLLADLNAGTTAHIYVGNLPDLTLLPSFSSAQRDTLEQTVQEWNAAIAEVVVDAGDTLVDLYTAYRELAANPGYIASDGLHPSTQGAKRLADFFYAVIVADYNEAGTQ